MIEVSRKPYAYTTSHRLEQVDVEMPDGSRAELIFKDLRRSRLHADALTAKPDFLHDPRREIEAYRILADAALGTAQCHEHGTDWVLIEKIPGVELWQIGELEIWADAARWLSRLHAHFDGFVDKTGLLVRYDPSFFSIWPRRAAQHHPELASLVAGYRRVVETLCALPPTLVHGEFYASNVMIAGPRIVPIDWEMTGIGPGVLDLAALLAGWGRKEREAIVRAYGRVAPEALAAAELHIAMQWVALSTDWTPPSEHARDWLSEAQRAARRLGL